MIAEEKWSMHIHVISIKREGQRSLAVVEGMKKWMTAENRQKSNAKKTKQEGILSAQNLFGQKWMPRNEKTHSSVDL